MRRETGLYMVLSLFDPFFFHIGVIFPIFQLSGNSPSEIEALMIMHSGPSITSTAILINFGDMKSIPKLDLFFIAFIAFSFRKTIIPSKALFTLEVLHLSYAERGIKKSDFTSSRLQIDLKLASQTCTSRILANDLLHHHYAKANDWIPY